MGTSACGEAAQAETLDLDALAAEPEWHTLLHYNRTLFGGVESEIDNESFFLSPRGKYDPREELEASIEALFGGDSTEQQALRCRYPARLRWLAARLEPEKPPPKFAECGELAAWLKQYEGAQPALVFASAFLENAASMFGHTFLRLDRGQRRSPAPLLEDAVSFAARTEEDRGLLFAFRGLTGGYEGRFGLLPYHVHVRNYGDIDDRDLWEYQLQLTAEEVERLLLHLWELQNASFDYYFLDENCSYHLLSLLEAARPSLELRKHFTWYAIPGDTIQQTLESPGLLGRAAFRPSLTRRIGARAAALSGEELEAAEQLVSGESSPTSETPAHVLDLALEVLQYRRRQQDLTASELESRELELLNVRSRLLEERTELEFDHQALRPDLGHRSRRLRLAWGYETAEQYLEAGFRLAQHELSDPLAGFPEGAELEFFEGALRYEPSSGSSRIEELLLVSIRSLPPRDRFRRPYSWGARLQSKRRRFDGEKRSLVSEGQFAGGVAYQPAPQLLLSGLTLVEAGLSGRFDENLLLGAGAALTAVWRPAEGYAVHILGEAKGHALGFSGSVFRLGVEQSMRLSRNTALATSVERFEEYGPSVLRGGAEIRLFF